MAISYGAVATGTGLTDTSAPYGALPLGDVNNAEWLAGQYAVVFYWRGESTALWGSGENPLRSYGASNTWVGGRIYANDTDGGTYGSVVAVGGVLAENRTGTVYNGEILNDHPYTNPVFCGQSFSKSGDDFDIAVVGTRVSSPGSTITVGDLNLEAGDHVAVYISALGSHTTQTGASISSDSHTMSSLTSMGVKLPNTLYWSITNTIRAYQYTGTVDSGSNGTGSISVSPGWASAPPEADVIVVRIRQAAAGPTTHNGSAALTSDTVLSSTALQGWLASAALSAQSNVTAASAGTEPTVHDGTAALSAESDLLSVAKVPAAFRGEFMSSGTAGPSAPAEDSLWDVNDQVWQAGDTVVGFQSRANGWIEQSSYAGMPADSLLESHNQTQRWGNIVAEENHPEMGHVAWFKGVAPDSRTGTTSFNGNIDTWFDRYQYTSHGIIVSGDVQSVQHLTTGWVHQAGASAPASFVFPNVHLQENDQIVVRYMSGSRYDWQVGGNRLNSHVLTASGVTFGGSSTAKVVYNSNYKSYPGDDTAWQRQMMLSSTKDSVTSGLGEDVTLTLTPTYNTAAATNWHRLDILIVSEWAVPPPVHDATVALTATGTLTGSSRVNGVATTVTDTAAALTAESNFTGVGDYVAAGVAAMSGETVLTAATQKDLEYFYNRGGSTPDNDLAVPYSDQEIATAASDANVDRIAPGDLLWGFYSSEEADDFGDFSGALQVQGSANWVGQRWAKTNTVGNFKNHVVLLGIADQANTGSTFESYIRGLYGNSRHGYGGHMRSVDGYDVQILQFQAQGGFSSGVNNRNLGSIDLAAGDQVVVMYALSDTALNSVGTFTAAGKTLSAAVAHPVRYSGQRFANAAGVDKPTTRHYCDWFEVTAGSAGAVDLYADIDVAVGSSLDLIDVIVLRVRNSFEPLPVVIEASISAESDLVSDAGVYVAPITLTGESGLASAGFVVTEAGSALTAETDLASDGTRISEAASALSAESTLTGVGDYIAMGSASLVGASSATLTAVAVRPGDVALVASSDLTADGFVIIGSTVDLTGDLTVTVSGVMLSADADLTATSALSADATHVNLAASDLSGTATLSVSGVTLLATASMDSTVTVAASGVAARFAGSALTFESGLDADGWVTFGSTIDISSQSNMEGAAVRIRPGVATLTVQSSLTATAKKVTRATVTMTALGTLTAQGGTKAFADAALTATLTVAARGGPILDGGTATLSAESVIAPVDYQYFVGVPNSSVALSGQSELTAVTSPIYRLHLPSLERTYTSDRLWRRYPIPAAACLIIKNGVATVKDYPNDLELKQADYYWMGGYNNPLTPETRQVIIDAGYGDWIEEA